jgi:chromosome partitioning protein
MKTIALYNMKGGVGKTSSAVNLAYLAAEEGHRTLLCDLDPQGSASFYFRVTAPKKMSAKHLVKGDDRFLSSIKATNYENLDILPADFSFRNLSKILQDKKRSKKRIKEALEEVQNDYDIVFLDTQPALNLEAENIFSAADLILVPVIPSTLSIQTLQLVRRYFNKNDLNLKKLWVFFSLVDRRKKLHIQTMEEVAGRESNILQSAIPYSSSVEKMGITREPMLVHSRKSKAAAAYLDLWRELHRLVFPGEKPVHFIP